MHYKKTTHFLCIWLRWSPGKWYYYLGIWKYLYVLHFLLFINGVEQITRERAHSRLSDGNLSVLTEAYFKPEKHSSITALVDS